MNKVALNQDIADKVIDILVEEFELERELLTLDVNLFEELELDSLDAVDLIVALEKLFAFRADEEQVKQLRTIRNIVNFIEEYLATNN